MARLSDTDNSYVIKPMYIDGYSYLLIGKNGFTDGMPELDANTIVQMIQELKQCLTAMSGG